MKNTLITLFAFLIVLQISAQSILTIDEAKVIAIENSYNTQMSKNQLALVTNNTRLIKSGRKPTLAISAGLNGNLSNSIIKNFAVPEATEEWLAPSLISNIAANSNILLWDGGRIKHQLKQNEASLNQADLSLRATKENIIYQVENVYINILLLQEKQQLLEESSEISAQRKLRAQYTYDYGQANKLNLLNATVDLNIDSLDLIKFQQQVVNLKRNLNLLLNRDININYKVTDEELSNQNLYNLEQYITNSEANNIDILLAKEALEISSYDQEINNTNLKPKVFANASYGINYINNSDASFIDYNLNDGLRVGLSTSWNLIDGGRTKLLNENNKLKMNTQTLQIEQLKDRNRANITNTWGDYQNAKKLFDLETINVSAALENFQYSQEQFKQGQINSISFRLSQLNLLNAKVNRTVAKYEVTLYELDLKQLTGSLLD